MNKFRDCECDDYNIVSGEICKILRKIREERTPLEEADAEIRKHYTAERLKIERLSGKALSMEQCYINLALVEQPGKHTEGLNEASKEGDTASWSSPFSLSARLKVETPEKNI
jgi:hypothetical protein